MTPAIESATDAGIVFSVHAYAHDPRCAAYGMEAVEKLGLAAAEVFKTLVVSVAGLPIDTGWPNVKDTLVTAIIPVATTLNLKRLAKVLGAKKAVMADANTVQRSTGYILGGVSPLGQKQALPTVLDCRSQKLNVVHVSAGRRGLEMALSPSDLARLTSAIFADVCVDSRAQTL